MPPPRKHILVDYSDDSDPPPPPRKLRKKATKANARLIAPASSANTNTLPPLPARFHELYTVAPRIARDDDPALHAGRQRSIPHIPGNWPTHVCIEWVLKETEFDILERVYNVTSAATGPKIKLHSHLRSDLGIEQPLHLSLSRPNVLRTEEKGRFLEVLESQITAARFEPFSVCFTGFEWVSNADNTRSFFVLQASPLSTREKEELPRLLGLTNRVFAAYKQPALCSPDGGVREGFHVSLAWSLDAPSEEVREKVQRSLDRDGVGREAVGLRLEVGAVRVKIGNVVHSIALG